MEQNPSPYQTNEYGRETDEDTDPKTKKKKRSVTGARLYSVGDTAEAWGQLAKKDALEINEKKEDKANDIEAAIEKDDTADDMAEAGKDEAPAGALTKEEDTAVGTHHANVSLAVVRQEVQRARPDSPDEVVASAHQALLLGARQRIADGLPTHEAAAAAYDEVAAALEQEETSTEEEAEIIPFPQKLAEVANDEDTDDKEEVQEQPRRKGHLRLVRTEMDTDDEEDEAAEYPAEAAAEDQVWAEQVAEDSLSEANQESTEVVEPITQEQTITEAEGHAAEAAEAASDAAIAEALIAHREQEQTADEARKTVQELERKVTEMRTELASQGQRIRRLARAASGDHASHQVRRMAQRLHQISTTQPPAKPIAEQRTETRQATPTRPPERMYGERARTPLSAETSKEPSPKDISPARIESLPMAAVLAMADKILIDKVPLRRLYEAHSFSEQRLRHMVAEHARGHDIREALAHELLDKELRFELDPTLHGDHEQDPKSHESPKSSAAAAFEVANQVGRSDIGADGMTSQERAAARYEQENMVRSKQLNKRLNAMFGGAFGLLIIIILILLLQR